MGRLESKRQATVLRKDRIRDRVRSHGKRMRLSIKISSKNVSAQIIDDSSSKTLISASTTAKHKGTMTEKAVAIGEEIAKKAASAKIKKVVLDRNGKIYHGRVKALAEAARKGGLDF